MCISIISKSVSMHVNIDERIFSVFGIVAFFFLAVNWKPLEERRKQTKRKETMEHRKGLDRKKSTNSFCVWLDFFWRCTFSTCDFQKEGKQRRSIGVFIEIRFGSLIVYFRLKTKNYLKTDYSKTKMGAYRLLW